jgi:acyl carrier protein
MTSLNEVFRDVMDDPNLALTESTTAAAVEGWDSVTHVMMIVAVEKKFSVKFTTAEIHALRNVGDIVALIVRKARG